MDAKVTSYGFAELKRAFKQMPPEIANKVLVAGVNAAAKVIRDAARADAPRHRGQGRSTPSYAYGHLFENIKFKTLSKRNNVSRAAVVSRGRAYWGDFLNRGTRYIPATRWYDKVLNRTENQAISAMKAQMVKKMNSLVDSIIRKNGAGRK